MICDEQGSAASILDCKKGVSPAIAQVEAT